MLLIQFSAKTLLYGESFLWLMIAVVRPFLDTPDFNGMKPGQRLAVHHLPGLKTLCRYQHNITKNQKISKFITRAYGFIIIIFLLLYGLSHAALQEQTLESLGILVRGRSNELAHKVLYYAPSLNRICLIIVIIINLDHKEGRYWETQKKFDIFSVPDSTQFKYVSLIAVILFLDWCVNLMEYFHFTVTILPQHLNWFDEIVSTGRWSSVVFVLSSIVLISIAQVVRYRPMVHTMYAAMCLTSHLKLINKQLNRFYSPKGLSNSLAYTLPNRRNRSQSFSEANLRAYKAKFVQTTKNHLLPISRGSKKIAQISSQNSSDKNGIDHDQVIYIDTIYELEKHLTQLRLYVTEVDCQSPETVFACSIINYLMMVYTIFYAFELNDWHRIVMSWFALLSRFIPLILLFVQGHLLGLQRHRLYQLLEFIYLRDPSQCLIYKQMTDGQLSLARVFRTVDLLRFDCDGLIGINLDSLFTTLIYLLAAVFLVIQYDSFISKGIY